MDIERKSIPPQVKRSFKGLLIPAAVLVVIIFLACSFLKGYLWFKINTKGYQALFMESGQVYFGHLSSSGRWLKLSDIYYLQVTQPLQQTEGAALSNDNQNIQLVKLGKELHGPEDTMYISKEKVMFWENLKDDSKVVQAIVDYKVK